jgi:hypothetical protein
MARPGQTESESVSIWLKLSEADAEQLHQVLARPEFAGWTKAEWCLEIIQTALRYYAKRPVAEPGRTRAPSAAAEPSPPGLAPEPAAPPPRRAAPKRKPPTPRPERAAPKRKPAAPRPERAAPEPEPVPPEPERAGLEPERAGREPERAGLEPEPKRAGLEPEPVAAAQSSPPEAECPHPADARDYQTGTCAACGAILWD